MADAASQITFDDAAIYFNEEQWGNLEDFQKVIYKDLIKEIYDTMIYLGYRIPKPEIVSLIERGEEPYKSNPKKQRLQESQPADKAAKKDLESPPAIKSEPSSPVACNNLRPGEISSSQEKNSGLLCQACGAHCNNQCERSVQWNAQRMQHMSQREGTQRKQYVNPPPPYFNGNVVSPHYGGAHATSLATSLATSHVTSHVTSHATSHVTSHVTSPVTSYANVGMMPVSPHYSGYNSTFAMPQQAGNAVFRNFSHQQTAPQGPPGVTMGNPDHAMRSRQWPHENPAQLLTRDGSFQDRRGMASPCGNCGAFCNNQCAMRFHWEQQKRLHHHTPPGVLEGNQANRFPSPPNPYFGGNPAVPHFANVRPCLRQSSPMNAQANMGMGQISPQYAGYRKPGEPNSPIMRPVRPEMNTGNLSVPGGGTGGNAVNIPTNISSQGNNLGTSNRNQRRKQTLSPYVNFESMPMNPARGSPNTVNEQRIRPPNPVVTSSESQVDKSNIPPNSARKQDSWRFVNQGNTYAKPISPAQANNGKSGNPSTGESNKTPTTSVTSPTFNNSYIVKHVKPSTVSIQDAVHIGSTPTFNDGQGLKRAAPPAISTNAKRSSPLSIIGENAGVKRASPLTSTCNSQSTASPTPPAVKAANTCTSSIMLSKSQDTKAPPPETKEGRLFKRATPPITISNIRSSGVFLPPPSKAKKTENNKPSSSPIIIIDDTDTKPECPPGALPNATNKEVKSSVEETCPSAPIVTNVKSNQNTPVASPVNKPQTPSVPQGGGSVLLNNLQVQQSSPIIVTGNTNLGGASLPMSVKGNQSIMFTFPVAGGGSGIMLATPVNRIPISKNARGVPNNTKVPINKFQGNVNTNFSPVTVTSIVGNSNHIPVTMQSGQAKPIAVNVNPQTANVAGNLNMKNTNISGGTINATPVSASGNQTMGQTIPFFVDAKTGLILTAPSMAMKDNSGVRNATVVTVNGSVVNGNLSFSNITPVNVNGGLAIRNPAPVNNSLGIGNTTFFTVDGTPVTLTGNTAAINNKGTLSINSPTILTMNGRMGIGNAGQINAPISNITPVDANGSLRNTQTPTANIIGCNDNQGAGIVVRKVNEPSTVHLTSSNSGPSPQVVDRLYKCSQCEENFTSVDNLNAHQKTHKDNNKSREGNDELVSKNSETQDLTGAADSDAPTILYTTQGDDGSTVYVVTV